MPRIEPLDPENAPPDARAAADAHVRGHARMTNMKRTLLRSLPAFDALMEWYTLRDATIPRRAADDDLRPRDLGRNRLPHLLHVLPPDPDPDAARIPTRLELDDREHVVVDFGAPLGGLPVYGPR